MQRLFSDDQLNDEYDKNGFVKIPFASAVVLQQLQRLFLKFCPEVTHNPGQVFYSMFSNSVEQNLQLKGLIKELLEESYQRTFAGYQSFAEMFLAKFSDNEELTLHQDWSYVHESQSSCITLWLPLQKTTRTNGTLFLIPGSHHFIQSYRGGSLPSARIAMTKELQKYCQTIDVEQGEAVFFHPAIFHGSHPNVEGTPRLVAGGILIAGDTQTLFFHKSGEKDLIKSYKLADEDFFRHLDSLAQGNVFPEAKCFEEFEYKHKEATSQLLLGEIENTTNVI